MDNNVVAFGPAPAHIVPGGGARLNAAAQAGIQASFAVLKIKNKVWRIRYRGEERLLAESPGSDRNGKPLPVAPVAHLDVIVVGAAAAISKRFYLGGFVEGAEAKAPDCFSINGVTPDAASAFKQSPTCATCPKNVWGSLTTNEGRKSKACSDRKRIAVVPAADPANEGDGGPMLLDIPPASIKVLDQYIRVLNKNGMDLSQVITRLGFDPLKTLELTFDCVGWIQDGRAYATSMELADSEQVKRMLNEEVIEATADAEGLAIAMGPRPAHIAAPAVGPARMAPADAMEGDPEDEEEAPAPTPVPAPKPAPAPAPGPDKAAVTASMRKTVSDMAAKAAPKVVVQGAPLSMEDEIARLLNNDDC